MYEVWLALNIVYEIGRDIWPLALTVLVLVLGMYAVALTRRGADWRRGFMIAAAAWIALTLILVVTVPAMTKSSLSDVTYLVDWANLVAVSAGLAAIAAVLIWPLSAMLLRRRTVRDPDSLGMMPGNAINY